MIFGHASRSGHVTGVFSVPVEISGHALHSGHVNHDWCDDEDFYREAENEWNSKQNDKSK